jgi:hypothetical protein
MDPDFDEISTIAENGCGLNPNSNDTEGDVIMDGIEDAHKNGPWDPGETNRLGEHGDGGTAVETCLGGWEDVDKGGVLTALHSGIRDCR